jgi:hypothetical protein
MVIISAGIRKLGIFKGREYSTLAIEAYNKISGKALIQKAGNLDSRLTQKSI